MVSPRSWASWYSQPKVLFSKISNDKGHVLYKLLPEEREKQKT